MEERALIQQILSGDTDAYASIVRDYQAKVIGLCLSLLNNSTQAEDAAQEIFIKVYRSLRSFRGDSSFSTWLYRIAANHCKDLLRKKSREKTESLDALIEASGDAQKPWEPALEPPSKDTSHFIETMLSSLSADERLILTLREVQGLSYQEISAALQCSLDAVKARLRRARAAIQEKARHFSGQRDV